MLPLKFSPPTRIDTMASLHRMTDDEYRTMEAQDAKHTHAKPAVNLELEDMLRMSIQSCADILEATFCGQLKAPPVGVYRLGILEPVMEAGKTYYYREGIESYKVTTENLGSLTKAVYDENYKCVIAPTYMQNKDKFLSNTPMLPYRGSYIVRDVMRAELAQNLAYYHEGPRQSNSRIVNLRRLLDTHFTNRNYDTDLVLDCCAPLIKDLILFFNDKRWHIYTLALHNTVLTVERGMDWRAKEWEDKLGEQFRNGTYR